VENPWDPWRNGLGIGVHPPNALGSEKRTGACTPGLTAISAVDRDPFADAAVLDLVLVIRAGKVTLGWLNS
jgi:hypothetical protein